jgi:hypothetical protein
MHGLSFLWPSLNSFCLYIAGSQSQLNCCSMLILFRCLIEFVIFCRKDRVSILCVSLFLLNFNNRKPFYCAFVVCTPALVMQMTVAYCTLVRLVVNFL